jgi:signal transduction histidine kinase/CheY-like chemotaxis protein
MGPDAIRLFEGFVAAAGHFLPGVALTLWESSETGVRLLAGTADPVLRERLKATPADPDLMLLPLGPFFLTAVLDRALTPREREGLTRLATQTITHATLLDQVLRAKREWEQTVDTIHDPLTIVSPDLRVVRANAAAGALTGESPKAIVGRPCFSALRGRAEPCPGCPLQMPTPSHEPTFLEFSPVFDRRTHHAFLYPVFDDAGRLTAMIEHIRDVSGQRELVETMVRAQKAGALVTMVAGIAHNFNNLLDIILGQAQLLQRRIDGSALRQRLDTIIEATQDAAALIRRLRDLSRSKPTAEGRGAVDLAPLIRECLTQAQTSRGAQAGRVEARATFQPTRPVLGNPGELKEVIVNLLFNALDAMLDGGTLTVTTREAGGGVELSIADTGVGMTDEVRQRMFDPFFTTKGGRGTGLGLSISAGIIHRHGGSIRCESGPGKGSCFTIRLPAAPLESEGDRALDGPPLQVLVVDDDNGFRESLADLLEDSGCHVTRTTHASEALSQFRPGVYDLALIDLALTDFSGWQVAQAFRQADRGLVISLMSGWRSAPQGSWREIGVDEFLNKPFGRDQLDRLLTLARRRRIPHPALTEARLAFGAPG